MAERVSPAHLRRTISGFMADEVPVHEKQRGALVASDALMPYVEAALLESGATEQGITRPEARGYLRRVLTEPTRYEDSIGSFYVLAHACIRYSRTDADALFLNIALNAPETTDILNDRDDQLFALHDTAMVDANVLPVFTSIETYLSTTAIIQGDHALDNFYARMKALHQAAHDKVQGGQKMRYRSGIPQPEEKGQSLMEAIDPKVQKIMRMLESGRFSSFTQAMLKDPLVSLGAVPDMLAINAVVRLRNYYRANPELGETIAVFCQPDSMFHHFILPSHGANDLMRGAYRMFIRQRPEAHKVNPANPVLDDISSISTLEYLREQAVSEEEGTQWAELASSLRQELKESGTRSPSLRREIVEITDPELIADGYTAIEFSQRKDMAVQARIQVGNYIVSVQIDHEFAFRLRDGLDGLLTDDARTWWENVVLLHLRPIMVPGYDRRPRKERDTGAMEPTPVMEEEASEDDTIGIEEIQDLRFRRSLLREGYNFTPTQAILARVLAGRDLQAYNEARALAGEARRYTWMLPGVREYLMREPDTQMFRHLLEAKRSHFNPRNMQAYAAFEEWLTENRERVLDAISPENAEPLRHRYPNAMKPLRDGAN